MNVCDSVGERGPVVGSALSLLATIFAAQPSSSRRWLDDALATSGLARGTRASFDGERFFEAFSSAARHLGKRAVVVTERDAARLSETAPGVRMDAWGLDELGRATLLAVAIASVTANERVALADACFLRGDNRERQAVLRTLAFILDDDGAASVTPFVSLAVEACRTSVQTVFEAICCENPFPARYFPSLHFNQMVLKALFTGASLSRVVGLSPRTTPELVRMVSDYAAERRAAGRSVPTDIHLFEKGGAE